VVLGVWVLIGLCFTLNYYLYADHYVAIFTRQPTFREMFIWEMPYWLLWAGLTPVVLRVIRRFPIDRRRWLRNSLLHLLVCVMLSFAHRGAYLILGRAIEVRVYTEIPSIFKLYEFMFFFNLPTGFMCYGSILLFGHVIDYYRRFQHEELKASQLETRLAQAQLSALKMQLHPHFLFNTLNSIAALQLKDVKAANRMVALLGDFLRLTLENSGSQEVRLQQELEFLKCYLDIQHIRFQERLSVRMDIEAQTLDAQVPNLILQPIVENAIKHGIAQRAAPGRIEIIAKRVDGKLQVEVKDDGPGIGEVNREGIKEGLGLTNTRARLSQLYGAAHRLEMADGRGGGVVVTLEIPFSSHDGS
jgi:sensor histidine kinase YesM